MRPLRPLWLALPLLFVATFAHAGADARLRIGDPVPAIEGRTLDGRQVVVPGPQHRPAVLLMGFVKDSREDVKRWAESVRVVWQADSSFDFYEMPMVGSGGRLFAGMITGSMRNSTAPAMQAHMLPLFRDAGLWQKRLGIEHPQATVLVVVGRDGKLAWQGSGPFAEAAWKSLDTAIHAASAPPPAH